MTDDVYKITDHPIKKVLIKPLTYSDPGYIYGVAFNFVPPRFKFDVNDYNKWWT